MVGVRVVMVRNRVRVNSVLLRAGLGCGQSKKFGCPGEVHHIAITICSSKTNICTSL